MKKIILVLLLISQAAMADYKTCFKSVSIEKATELISQMYTICQKISTDYGVGLTMCDKGAKDVYIGMIRGESNPLEYAVNKCAMAREDCINGAVVYTSMLCREFAK